MLKSELNKLKDLSMRLNGELESLHAIRKDLFAVYSFHTNYGPTITEDKESIEAYEQDKVLENALDTLDDAIRKYESACDEVERITNH